MVAGDSKNDPPKATESFVAQVSTGEISDIAYWNMWNLKISKRGLRDFRREI